MAQAVAMSIGRSLCILTKRGNPSHSLPKFSTINFQGLSIPSVRVGGVEIPNNKRVEIALQSIHGIGRTHARLILFHLNMPNKVAKDLSQEELTALRDEVSKYMIGGELRQFNARAIKRLKEIQCYRGIRHIQCLPCRGQQTRHNCRTLKGKSIPVADSGKKKATR